MSLPCTKTRGRSQPTAATLFHQAQSGNREALNQLMVRHDGLVHAVLRRQSSGTLSCADTLQAGRIGLWHAILRYDPTRGFAFSTYAWNSIMRHIWRAVKAESPKPHCMEVTHAVRSSAADPAILNDDHAVEQTLHALVNRLPSRLQQTVNARYGLDGDAPASFAHIGRALGLSAERARQLHWEALFWLQQPAHSQTLRTLLNRHTTTDYPTVDALQQRWWYPRRGCDEH